MKGTLRTAGVALLFLVGSLALANFAAFLLGVPSADLPAVAVLLAVAGGGGGLLALLLIRPAPPCSGVSAACGRNSSEPAWSVASCSSV